MNDIVASLAASPFAAWAAGTAYPLVNVAHLIGLVMLLGAIGIADLRLVGLLGRVPLRPLVDALTPWAVAGFTILVVSGIALFASDAVALAASTTFRIKLALIAAAVLNAALFRRRWLRHARCGDQSIPPAARAMAAASLMLWLAVLTSGRMIAYS